MARQGESQRVCGTPTGSFTVTASTKRRLTMHHEPDSGLLIAVAVGIYWARQVNCLVFSAMEISVLQHA